MAERTTPHIVECAVIGGSVAGLSAALVLGRSRRRTVVIDAGSPINSTVDHSHGFLTRDGAPPHELVAIGREQLGPYGVELVDGIVTNLRRFAGGFVLEVDGGLIVSAQRVIVATGMRVDLPDVPGLRAAWGKGVATCPYCHGWEVRDQALGVLAVDPQRAVHLATLLTQWSPDVTLYTQGLDIGDAVAAVKVERRPVAVVEERDGMVTGLKLDDGERVPCGGLFLGVSPRLDGALLKSVGVNLDQATGWPVLDPSGRSSVDGLWVAGNAASPMYTLMDSASSGARAAMMINSEWILNEHGH